MRYDYIFQRTGGPLLTWKDGPPNESRAADTLALGCSCAGTKATGTLSAKANGSLGDAILPRPGAPEVMGSITGELTDLRNPLVFAGWATAAYLLWRKLKKK